MSNENISQNATSAASANQGAQVGPVIATFPTITRAQIEAAILAFEIEPEEFKGTRVGLRESGAQRRCGAA